MGERGWEREDGRERMGERGWERGQEDSRAVLAERVPARL